MLIIKKPDGSTITMLDAVKEFAYLRGRYDQALKTLRKQQEKDRIKQLIYEATKHK